MMTYTMPTNQGPRRVMKIGQFRRAFDGQDFTFVLHYTRLAEIGPVVLSEASTGRRIETGLTAGPSLGALKNEANCVLDSLASRNGGAWLAAWLDT